MSDLILNALRRKATQADQLGFTDQAKRLNARIAEREGEAPTEQPVATEESDDLADLTKAELLDLANEREIEGRHHMNKAELVEALNQTQEA